MIQYQCLTVKGSQCLKQAKTGSAYCTIHKNCKKPLTKSMTLSATKKPSGNKTYDVDFIKKNLSIVMKIITDNLKKYVYFDYETREVLLAGDKVKSKDLLQYAKETFADDDHMIGDISEKVNKLKEYIDLNFLFYKNWFDVPVLPDLKSLLMTNQSGFNDDERSHKGDVSLGNDLPSDQTIKKRFKAPCAKNEKINEDDCDLYRYKTDQMCQETEWEIHHNEGITWGDIMIGVMSIKGSKSDWWYELMGDFTAQIKGSQLLIDVDFDFGS